MTDAEERDGPITAEPDDVQGATAANALDRVTDLEIDGVQVHGPKEGFGPLWRKRYWVQLNGVKSSPAEIVRVWRERFGSYWPAGDRFFSPMGRLDPGDVGLIDLEMPAGTHLSGGVVVLDVQPESFTLITPSGHVFAGVITFSVYRSSGVPVVQIEIIFRSSDPLFEIGMRAFGHERENRFWLEVLRSLARDFGVDAAPAMHAQVLDDRYQWTQVGNLAQNAVIRKQLGRGRIPFDRLSARFRPTSPGETSRSHDRTAADGAGLDAVVVGAGPNGLAAAITLAEAGRTVRVLEANDTIGGGCRSLELTNPGFVHDICSAIHPLGVASPFFRDLPLERYGLEWIEPPLALAHPFDDGTAAVLFRSLDETVARLGPDGESWRDLFNPFIEDYDILANSLLGPFPAPRHPFALARFGLVALRSADSVARSRFSEEPARALFAGMAAHSMLALDQPISASFGLMLGVFGHVVGWPIARGGSQRIVDAMAAHLRSLGGEIETNHRIATLDQIDPDGHVLFDVTPRQILEIAGTALPRHYTRQLRNYRYGAGVFKVDWALDGPVPWSAPDCHRAGTLHLGGSLDEIAAAEKAVSRGEHPERPFVIAAQPSRFDPTRAPEGKHVLWAYCHVPNGSSVDMTERIERQIERYAPGFRDLILARSTMDPAELEHHNANYIGGDINGGRQGLRQLFTRPAVRLDPYSTPNPRLFICSSSTPPGGGVHGMCGYHAARSVISTKRS